MWELGPDAIPGIAGDLRRSRRRALVIDEGANALYGGAVLDLLARHGIEHPDPLVIPAGEAAKTWDTAQLVIAAMDRFGVGRHEGLIAVGGGVVHDVCGFAASIYRRGVPWYMIGTTLVAAIDAGFALKSAINGSWKNRLGSYHPPSHCLFDPAVLTTLSDADIREGMAEIVKWAIAGDRRLFRLLERDGRDLMRSKFQEPAGSAWKVIARTQAGMGRELAGNPYERSSRRPSYLGHGLSPAMEPAVPHGVAVMLDTMITTRIGEMREVTHPDAAADIFALTQDLGFRHHRVIDDVDGLMAALIDTARHRQGQQLITAPTRIGRVTYLNKITRDELAAAVDWVRFTQQ